MSTSIKGISLQVRDKPSTPFFVGRFTGLSLTVDLRTFDIAVYRLDVSSGAPVYVPVENMPVTIKLQDSAQQYTLLTDAAGLCSTEFPDTNLQITLAAGSVPVGHSAPLVYPYRINRSGALTVVFIPDSIRRFYPNTQTA